MTCQQPYGVAEIGDQVSIHLWTPARDDLLATKLLPGRGFLFASAAQHVHDGIIPFMASVLENPPVVAVNGYSMVQLLVNVVGSSMRRAIQQSILAGARELLNHVEVFLTTRGN